MTTFYLATAILGTLLPWVFFGSFFAENGFALWSFVLNVFANDPARGFTIDILISIAVFWVWSFIDARQLGVKGWVWTLPACCCVGLSLGLPLYLYLRPDRAQEAGGTAPS